MANQATVPSTPTKVEASTPSMVDLLALIGSLKSEIDKLKESATGEVIHAPSPTNFAKSPWEEELWVEAINDVTYPDPHDPVNYAKYRFGRKEDQPGDVFRIAHREHLNKHLRLLKNDEKDNMPKRETPKIPQTAARGVRVVDRAY